MSDRPCLLDVVYALAFYLAYRVWRRVRWPG